MSKLTIEEWKKDVETTTELLETLVKQVVETNKKYEHCDFIEDNDDEIMALSQGEMKPTYAKMQANIFIFRKSFID